MADNLEPIGLRAVLETAAFQKGMAIYNAGLSQMQKLTDRTAAALGSAFKLATGALVVGGASIVAALATSVKAAADAEQIAAQTDAVLKSTKGIAGVTKQAVNDLATSFSELTPFEDDAIQGGENLLLTFTNIGKNVFPLATETMLDMSQAMGQDLKASAIQLGKALQDPAKGVSALAEVGVNFTESQKKVIEQLVKAGKVEQAQKLILKELQTEFGGAAKAAGKTFAGQLKILQNSLGNVQEEVGGALLPILTKVADALAKALADPQVKAGIKTITKGLGDFVDILEATAGALQKEGLSVAVNTFVTNLLMLAGVSDDVSNKMGDIAAGIAGAVERIVKATQTGGLGGFVSQLSTEIQNATSSIQKEFDKWGPIAWSWLTNPKTGAIAKAQANLFLLTNSLNTAIQQNWPTISKGLDTWKTQFWNWVTGKGGVIDNVATQMDNLTNAIRVWSDDPKTAKALENIGATVANTIIDGISNLFKDQEKSDSAMTHLVASLNQARFNLAASFANIGGNIGTDVASGLYKYFTGADVIESARQSIDAWITAAVKAFVLGDALALGQMLADAILNAFKGNQPQTPEGPAAGTNGPAYASGGFVRRTEMALVHQGEYVIPARQASQIVNNNSRTIGPGAVVINLPAGSSLSSRQVESAAYRAISRVMAEA